MTSYRLKKISFNGREVPVVVQNENGPCPLLAIANTLLLRGMLTIAVNSPDISSDRLMQMVAEYLLDSNKVEDESPLAANVRKNLGDVISALPKLATGVDVNPSFNSFRGFEFTDEVAIFDMFDISLVHGWLVDPTHVNKGLGDFTYNQLVGKLIAILGDETPAHILSTHSSFKASSKRDTAQSSENISAPEEPPLIQFDSEELAPINVEAKSPQDAPLEELTPAEKHESEDVPTPPDKTEAQESSHDVDNVLEKLEEHREDDSSVQVTVSGIDENTVKLTIDSRAEDNRMDEPAVPGNSSDLAPNNPVLEERMKGNEFSIRAQQWLDETSNQLTDYGLKCLNEGLQDEQLAVFFRNNHFNTIYKRSDGLYLLVTDLGYLSEPGVVWEKLDDVDGNTQMMTDAFAPYVRPDHVNTTEDDVDLHRALAASLALDPAGNPGGRTAMDGSNTVLPHGLLHQNVQQPPVNNSDADLALALQLHEEELQRHEEMVQEAALETAQQQQSTRQTTAAHGQQAFSRRPQGAVNDTNRSRQSRHQNTAQFQGTREPTGFEKFSRSIKQFFAPKK